ncbi:alpha/beta fold hydrolase BchO [Phenylobacterium sp.]|uniref:alpha/beta fold hydrolase BchO n=1 Tax=Phenylobacterium sp. TaxID=1871053 RepID=UPI0025FED9DA|nr:alpha/beta fold hydrolase BchO [Phenylobacterium sp.]
MRVRPDWDREGRDWPNRAASRFVRASGLDWHVQVMGEGPTVLMLHGSGAATHSWRDLAPRLARDFRVVAPDLPGHGFTAMPGGDGLTLPGMARALGGLLQVLEASPALVVGHSAGAAIALQMRLEGQVGDSGVVSINGALRPFPGSAGHIFPAMARLLFLNPLAIQTFAWRAGRPGAVSRLIEGTGSTIDAAGLGYYGQLLRTTGHVAGTLGMMANWDLQPLVARLPSYDGPLTLLAAEGDRAVPVEVSRAVKAMAPQAELIVLPGLGHLAHEEAPDRIADIVRRAARAQPAAAARLPSAGRSA